jgi:hypothetical protein
MYENFRKLSLFQKYKHFSFLNISLSQFFKKQQSLRRRANKIKTDQMFMFFGKKSENMFPKLDILFFSNKLFSKYLVIVSIL